MKYVNAKISFLFPFAKSIIWKKSHNFVILRMYNIQYLKFVKLNDANHRNEKNPLFGIFFLQIMIKYFEI